MPMSAALARTFAAAVQRHVFFRDSPGSHATPCPSIVPGPAYTGSPRIRARMGMQESVDLAAYFGQDAQQLRQVRRLDQVAVETGLARAFAVFALAVAGQRDQHGIG